MTFRGKTLNLLPISLKVFYASFCIVEDIDAVSYMRNMVNLEELKLDCIRQKEFLASSEQVTDFIQSALRHRRINGIQN
jgi:hypothetical protein